MTEKLSKDAMIDAISGMSVLELSELVKSLETKFGVSAAAPMGFAPAAAAGGAPAAAAEEKTDFTVVLASAGPNKIPVIKVVREITGLGLKEAKDIVDAAPKVLKASCNKTEADEILKKITAAGGQATVKGL